MTIVRRVAEYTLIALIFSGSLVLWLGIPLGGLWLVSKLSDSRLIVIFAVLGVVCPLAMLALGLVLARLNGAYYRLLGAPPDGRRTPGWRTSLSGDRSPARRPRAVLETSLTLSVLIALVAFVVWFLFFAHSPLPAPPAP